MAMEAAVAEVRTTSRRPRSGSLMAAMMRRMLMTGQDRDRDRILMTMRMWMRTRILITDRL